ncbi:hypothetical protein C7H19_09370 [Aphanothece hegewaldii CCALA 016]|uniref:Uncharacterized protein n=1 Tax=Aphanothece hegewaldii CCALA 016 TaxID=2107694 RepID=A0A2T1LZH7_9CHRO|nr:hypothetical protein [Aphanothece hegewaldii]PSF37746.1 hypothetical protein C7H19_09370 [Aphanothece hegewaldii CCALA 016]
MKSQLQKSFTQIFIALVIEITLNCLGLDQLADYSEFVFKSDVIKLEKITKNIYLTGYYLI